ncbi:MAG: hypothetical protein KDA54_17135 [Phycisphaerales bacterium]|nr:hypothetical protein [Phycisphaerales bacterium]
MMTIEVRIARLERSVRNWKIAALSIGAVVMTSLMLGLNDAGGTDHADDKAPVKLVRAKALEIVNGSDAVICRIDSDAAGTVRCAYSYANGKPLLAIGQGDFGQAGLAVFSKSGTLSAELREGDVNGGMLRLLSNKMLPTIIASAQKNGDGVILVRATQGKDVNEITPRN